VAVVGAGPAGLTAALHLRRRGYAVTVFEELPEPGGMLRYGIPEYRMPRDVLAAEIQDILDTGVELRCSVRVGRHVELGVLLDEYQAVYLAIGAHRSLPLGVPGDDAGAVFGATEFLRAINMDRPPKIGDRVAVIGGGNAAVDAARSARRLGASQVTMLYRRERKDMPAWVEEIEAAEAEGIEIEPLVLPVRIEPLAAGGVRLVLERCRLGIFDRTGRRIPEPIDGSAFSIEVDTVISAVSQGPRLELLTGVAGVQVSGGRLQVESGGLTGHPQIWAGGDAVTGPALVIDAIRAGIDVAHSIDSVMRRRDGLEEWMPPAVAAISIPLETPAETILQPQARMPEASISARIADFREVELGFTVEMALAEAGRCMRCDARVE
jgi:NADH-quinone oxidoreductase subunit F